ncbi:MAG: hypothetical protein AB1483_04665 [Candidatus Zixiibacteriota bacterium]
MKSFREIIQAMSGVEFDGAMLEADAYSYLRDTLSGMHSKPTLAWCPTYAAESDKHVFIFERFRREDYADLSELNELAERITATIEILKKGKKQPILYFLTDADEDLEFLKSHPETAKSGVLHRLDGGSARVFSTVAEALNKDRRLLPAVVLALSEAKRLRGPIGDLIRKFCTEYLEHLDKQEEDKTIKQFIKDLLNCDPRFQLQCSPIDFMGEIESLLSGSGIEIRDHYYHAFNTMLIGYLVIDSAYDRFLSLGGTLGEDIDIEFLWLLISLYHDIGYPVANFEKITEKVFAMAQEDVSDTLAQQTKALRQYFWEEETTGLATTVIEDLFGHLYSGKTGRWRWDAFKLEKYSSPDGLTPFRATLKTAFVELGSHGAAGAIKMAQLVRHLLKQIDEDDDREFLYRHVLLAGVSILLHDYQVRSHMIENQINPVKAQHFGFSLLLTYVDIIQEDRRTKSAIFDRPDIFAGVVVSDGGIRAQLSDQGLSASVKKRLLKELSGALSFFEMNGVTFIIPLELSA